MTIETKSAFARRRGRTPTAVGQWIRAGLISGAALEGKGRSARINVEVAEAQLAARLDPGQALGNGASTLKATSSLKPSQPSKSPRPSKSQPSKPVPSQEPDEDADEDGTDPVYAREKARLAKAQADAQEMKNALARGDQVEVAQVERHWSDVLNAVKARALAMTGRIRSTRPTLTTEDIDAIDREIRDFLTAVSRHEPI